MNYCIKKDKLVFISENKVECLGEIINLSETLYFEFKMQEEVATHINNIIEKHSFDFFEHKIFISILIM